MKQATQATQATGAHITETRTTYPAGTTETLVDTTRSLPTSYPSVLFQNSAVTINADAQLAGWRVSFFERTPGMAATAKDVLSASGKDYIEVRRNVLNADGSLAAIELLTVDARG